VTAHAQGRPSAGEAAYAFDACRERGEYKTLRLSTGSTAQRGHYSTPLPLVQGGRAAEVRVAFFEEAKSPASRGRNPDAPARSNGARRLALG
jgi:hypothetical protein